MNGSVKRYYFDTAAIWKYYGDEKGSLEVRRLVSRVLEPIVLSPMTLLEFVGVLMKYNRKGYITRKAIRKVVKRLRRDTGINSKNRPFKVFAMPSDSFKRAENILLENACFFNVGSNDCLHLAIVKHYESKSPNLVMVTSDNSLKKVCSKNNIEVYDPEETD